MAGFILFRVDLCNYYTLFQNVIAESMSDTLFLEMPSVVLCCVQLFSL